MSRLATLAGLALVPAMLGPLPASARLYVPAMCSDAGAARPLLPEPPGPPQGPCCAKGCHASAERKADAKKRLDPKQ